MASSTIPWGTGSGNIYLTYTGAGNGSISVTSDPNPLPITRVQTLVVRCPNFPYPAVVLNVWQAPGSKVLQASFDDSFDLSYEKGAVVPTEYTARLVPSAYTASNGSYVVVSDASNMYNNTDHTSNYASIRGRGGRSTNSTYYCFIRGFNFSAIPDGANIKSFRVLVRCSRNGNENTGSSYRMRLASQANNNNVISGTTTDTDIDTTASVIEIPTGSLTWNTIKGYKENFSIEIRLRNTSTSSSQYPYVYVYGAEIEVKYEI